VEYLVTAERCLLGLVFLVSAGGKARDARAFAAFAASVREFAVLPTAWTRGRVVPAAVVAIEALVPVLLLARTTTAAGLALASVLLAGLAAAVAVVVRRDTGVSCLCFGGTAAALGRRHIARNLALAGVAGLGVLAALAPAPPLHAAGAATAAIGGSVIAVLVIAMDDLVDLFRPLSATRAE
jgi:hypothetical protein